MDLIVSGLGKSFGGLRAVNDLSFVATSGRITGLIGPNGAGKTTVFNLISGLLIPDAGEVRLGETRMTGLPAHQVARLGVARTFQLVKVVKEMTVLENVMVARQALTRAGFVACGIGLPSATREELAIRRRAEEMLERVGISDLAHRLAGTLSLGMQRKVELARALAREPRLVLADEPVSGLNQTEAGEVAGYLRSMTEAGISVLLVEHNIEFLMSVADSVVVLNHGEKLAEGSPKDVRNDIRVIEAYLGSVPVEAR